VVAPLAVATRRLRMALDMALAAVAAPYLPRWGRRLVWSLAVTVVVARVYVGAHLPLDVIGGAALGYAAAALVHLALGVPTEAEAEPQPAPQARPQPEPG